MPTTHVPQIPKYPRNIYVFNNAEIKECPGSLEIWGIPEGEKADEMILKVETRVQKPCMFHCSPIITGHGCGH